MHNNHHEFWWRFIPKKELVQIYFSMALRSFSLSLLGIFLPLYLYREIGFTLQETLTFYIFYPIVLAISCPFAAKFCSRFGVKHSVLLSMPLYITFLVLLYLLPEVKTPLIVIGALVGLALAFYWMGMHLIFHHASDHKHRGEELGKRGALMIFGTSIGPIIGGFLIKYFGFKPVLGLASVLLMASAIILFSSRENHPKYNFSFRSIVNHDHWKNSLFFASRGTQTIAEGVIWPLFIFLILNDYFSLGIVGSIMAGLSAVLVWFTGKYSDHKGKRKILRGIAGFEALAWVLKSLVKTVPQVFGATIFGAVTAGIKTAPMEALEYDKADDNVAAYFVNREIFICLGRLLLVSFVLMTESLFGGLIFHSIASLAILLF